MTQAGPQIDVVVVWTPATTTRSTYRTCAWSGPHWRPIGGREATLHKWGPPASPEPFISGLVPVMVDLTRDKQQCLDDVATGRAEVLPVPPCR
jgi:hypothetical protein